MAKAEVNILCMSHDSGVHVLISSNDLEVVAMKKSLEQSPLRVVQVVAIPLNPVGSGDLGQSMVDLGFDKWIGLGFRV